MIPGLNMPRYGYGKPLHNKLYKIIDKNRDIYRDYLNSFLRYKSTFGNIPKTGAEINNGINEPYWINGWIPGLDSISLYSILSINNPSNYIEIGSGISTKFVRRAIKDQNLKTKITVIDPNSHIETNLICDMLIRQPLEDIDISIFDRLGETGEKDILFVDGSHQIFMNSDVTTLFLDILPSLKKKCICRISRYIFTCRLSIRMGRKTLYRAISTCSIFIGRNKFEIILPNAFINSDIELSSILYEIWNDPRMLGVERHGGSFWIKMD